MKMKKLKNHFLKKFKTVQFAKFLKKTKNQKQKKFYKKFPQSISAKMLRSTDYSIQKSRQYSKYTILNSYKTRLAK